MTRRCERVPVEINGVFPGTEKGVPVIIKSTGKKANLPRRLVEFHPGLVLMPKWLADRIEQEQKEIL
jgi:hypothetical protein